MTGIYKIETPNGRIYIGQSSNIECRFKSYKASKKDNSQAIVRSILKYGACNHIFSVVCELPQDIDKKTLSLYEQIYMDQYRECGFPMMNLSAAAGSQYGCKRSEEQKRNHSEKMKGRIPYMKGKSHSEEVKKIIKAKRALQTNVSGPWGYIPWNKGKKGVQDMSYRKGMALSDETKEKIRQSLLGKKLSPESIKKRQETRKANGVVDKWPESARIKRAEMMRGKKQSPELILKRMTAIKATLEKKKALKTLLI